MFLQENSVLEKCHRYDMTLSAMVIICSNSNDLSRFSFMLGSIIYMIVLAATHCYGNVPHVTYAENRRCLLNNKHVCRDVSHRISLCAIVGMRYISLDTSDGWAHECRPTGSFQERRLLCKLHSNVIVTWVYMTWCQQRNVGNFVRGKHCSGNPKKKKKNNFNHQQSSRLNTGPRPKLLIIWRHRSSCR